MNTYVIVFENGEKLNLNMPYNEKELLDKFNEDGQYIILGDYLLPKYQIKWIEINRFPQYYIGVKDTDFVETAEKE